MKESWTPTEKKKFGTLGPKGLRRIGGKNIYGGTATKYSGQALEGGLGVGGMTAFFKKEEKMKQEGYGLFPESFEPPSFDSMKTFRFVRQDECSTVVCKYYKLAVPNKEAPKYACSNPFAQGMSFGDSQPLPRYRSIQHSQFRHFSIYSCIPQGCLLCVKNFVCLKSCSGTDKVRISQKNGLEKVRIFASGPEN